MLKQVSAGWTRVGLPVLVARRRVVIGAAVVLILAQLAFRAWVLYPSWFFLDDYNLLNDAQDSGLDLAYLFAPYNGHLMPASRLIAWTVADAGTMNWALAATITLLLQAMASAGALWMLVSLFGVRWSILAPLTIYLTSAMTVPALVWWAAALNQVALQAAFFFAVGAWVSYLRGRQRRWLLATLGATAFGLLFYVKATLLFPVLAYVALAYFASGSVRQRLVAVARRDWQAALAAACLLGGYVGYYLIHVDQPFTDTTRSVVAEIADSMIGTAFVSGAVGGPWRWDLLAPPTAYANPPGWAVHVSWVVAVLVVLYAFLRRHRTLRAWLLLAGYLAGLFALLVTSRAPSFGRVIGLEYRYLTDAACVLALCVGLAFLPLRGAVEASAPRLEPLLRPRVPPVGWAVLVLVVAVSGVYSSATYARFWHHDNASDEYVHNLEADLRAQGVVDLVDQPVPDKVMSHLAAPDNTTRRFVSLLSDRASFPETASRLAVVGPDGTLRQALIGPGVVSLPGPRIDCGWPVRSGGRTIDLQGAAFPWEWWLRIGYLGSQDSAVTVLAGESRVETNVEAGLNSLYVKVKGSFDTVRIDGLAPGTTLCVDTIEVGQPAAGGRLP